MESINTPAIARQLIGHFGGSQTKTARELTVSQPTVSGWLNDKHGISAATALRAEAITDGIFKAADLCEDLRRAARQPT